MKTKKILALLLCAMMSVSMVACAGTKENAPADNSTPAEQTQQDTPQDDNAAPSDGEGLNIVVVTSPNGVDDGSFNQDNYNGVLNFIKGSPSSTVKDIRETDINNSVPTVESVVADYDVVIVPGFQFASISQIALDNPEKKFVLVDSFPAEVDGVSEFENIYAMQFAEQESGFFAGVAAALQTKTNKVAVVNGIGYPSNVNYQFGFESGVNYANKHLGTAVEAVALPSFAGQDVTNAAIGGNYIGSFDDEARGKVLGEALLAEGVDIIFVAAGGAGNGTFTAVKENGNAFVIGCDVDQFDDGANGDKNIILTSVLKVMNINVERALNMVQDGSFQGQNVVLGADTDSTGYVKADGRHQLSDETIAKLDEVYQLVKEGKIVPAANFNQHAPDNFPGLN